MKPKGFFCIILLFLPLLAWADIKIGKGLKLDTLFYFKTDQDRALEEYFSLGAKLELEYDVEENWEFQLEVDAGTDKIRVDEVWGKYKFQHTRLKVGMFENWLIVDDIFTSRENIYAEDNPVRNRLDDMGWYSPGATGFKFYRNYKGDGLPLTAYSHLYFQPSAMEIQFDMGALWSYAGEGSYLGIMFAYFPFFIHDIWVDSNDSYTQDHNFLINAVMADFAVAQTVVYKLELTLANNLVDPVGYVHFPGEGEPSWFFGAYGYTGFPIGNDKKFLYTPGLNLSMLIHQLDIPEANSLAFRMGNKLEWRETFSLNVDLGLGINTYYSPRLVTGLELLWGVTLQVRI